MQQTTHPDADSAPDSVCLNYVELDRKRAWLYRSTLVVVLAWIAAYIFATPQLIPNALYWLSYYAGNYTAGFVRRGLAGQLIQLFPAEHYFTVANALMWGSVAVYFSSLAALAWHILFRGRRAERRLMLALLLPLLPCSVSFAVLGPRPEFVAAAALIFFGLALTRIRTSRAVVVGSACYGLIIAVLAAAHEAIPLLFALGAVLALGVLANVSTPAVRWLAMGLAVVPGLMATAAVVLLGRHDVAAQVCAGIPHKMMKNSFKVPPEKMLDYMSGRYESVSDYHDWVCHFVVNLFDENIKSAFHSVVGVGFIILAAGFVHGLLIWVGTIWLIRYFGGVPWKEFTGAIRAGRVLPLLALSMMVPIFATGVDWIRWWGIIVINVAAVYLIYSADRPEIESPVSARQVKAFIVVSVVLACVPLAGPTSYATGFAERA